MVENGARFRHAANDRIGTSTRRCRMHTQTRKTTVTFTRPFQLDGLQAALSAGVYNVESENDVLDGMFIPDCLRSSILIHLHATPGSPGYSQTLTVPWAVLEAALLWDRSSATTALPEPGLEEILLDPMVRQPMRSDGVSEVHSRDLLSHLPTRKPFSAKSDR
jgi:hypothetical protein